MAFNAGDIEAKLTLDRSDFSTGMKEARTEGEKFDKSKFEAEVAVSKTSENAFTKTVTAMQARLTKMTAKTWTAKIAVDMGTSRGNITDIQQRLTKLGNTNVKPKVRMDMAGEIPKITALQKKLDTLKNKQVTVKMNIKGAYQELMRLNATLNRVTRDRVINLFAHADMRDATNQLLILNRLANRIDGRLLRVRAKANTDAATRSLLSNRMAADSADEGMSRYTKRLLYLSALIASVAAPAIGYLSMLLMSLPALAFVAGAAIGAIALGIDGIKKAASGLEAPFNKMKESIAATFERGLRPIFNQLIPMFPMLTTGLNQVANGLVGWAGAFTNVVTSAQGMEQIKQILANIKLFMDGLQPSITAGMQAFLTLGQVGTQTMWSLAGAVNNFLIGFNQMISAAAQSGLLQQAFIQLGFVTGALLGAFNALFAAGIVMMAQLGGPLTQTFNTLGVVISAITPILITIAQLFMALLIPAMSALAQIATAVAPQFAALGNEIGATLGNAIVQATPALIEFAKHLINAAAVVIRLADGIINFLGPAFGPLVAGVIALFIAFKTVTAIITIYNGIMTIAAAVTATYHAAVAVGGAIIGGYNLIVRAVTSAMAAYRLGLGIATAAQWAWNVAMMSNPIGVVIAAIVLIIAAVAALAYGIYKLVENWDTVQAALSSGWQWLVDLFYRIWTPIAEWFSGLWDGLVQSVQGALGAIGDFFSKLGTSLSSGFQTALAAVGDFFWNFDEYFVRGLGFVLGSAVRGILWIANAIIEGIRYIGTDMSDYFTNRLPNQITTALSSIGTWITGSGRELVMGFLRGAESAFFNFMAWIHGIPNQVGAAFTDAYNWLTGPAVQMMQGWWNEIQREWGVFMEWCRGIPAAIGSFFSNAGTWLWQAGADIINGLISGVNSMGQAIRDEFMRLVNGFIESFKQGLGIASPSTVFMQFGQWLVEGLINGIRAMINAAIAIVQSLVDGILGIVRAFVQVWNAVFQGLSDIVNLVFNTIYQIATTIMTNTVNFVVGLIQMWQNTWASIFNAIRDLFITVMSAIRDAGQTILNAMVQFMQGIIQGFQTFWNGIWNAISSFFSGIWNAMEQFGRTVLNAMITFYQQGLSGFGQFWNTIWQAILTFFSQIWQQIQAFGIAIWNAISAFFTTVLNAFMAFWNTVWTTILTLFTTIWNNIFTTAQTIWNNINAFFQGAFQAFSSFFTTTWNSIRDSFAAAFGGIIAIATDIWNKVKGVFAAGLNAIINGVNWPIDKINGLFGISIPKIPNLPALATGGMIADGSGGKVVGRGTSKNDRVLTRLSNQEHVWSAREVKAAGGHDAVRKMRAAVLNPNRTAQDTMNNAQASSPNNSGIRHAMALNAAAMAPQDMGNGMLAGLKRLKMMDKNPILDDYGIPGYAPGGVRPHVAFASDDVERAVGRMPGGVGGLGSRSGPSDHPRGLALDFMTLSNSALGDRTAGYLLQNAGRLAVKYIIWKQAINSGSGWRGMENRGSITANHFDHVHASFLDGPGGGGGAFAGGGAGGLFTIDYGAIFDSMAGPFKGLGLAALKGLVPDNPPWLEPMGEGIYNKAWDGLRKKAIELMTAVGSMFGMGAGSGPVPGPGGGGAVERWRPLVLAALARVGQPASLADRVLMQIRSESGGNPNAVNNWDINARRGTPSGGLLQTIAPTFARYRDPSLPNNMFDPMANIVASMRYAMSRYGSLERAYRGVGYDVGGLVPKGEFHGYNATNNSEHLGIFTNDQWSALSNLAEAHRNNGGDTNNYSTQSGLTEDQVRTIVETLGKIQPKIGNLTIPVPNGSSVEDLVSNVMTNLRHYDRGVFDDG